MAETRTAPPLKSQIEVDGPKAVWTPPVPKPIAFQLTVRELPPDPRAEWDRPDPYKDHRPSPNAVYEILDGAVGPFVKGEFWQAGSFPRYTDFKSLEETEAIRRVA